MKKIEVAVVGGGPAGLSAAIEAAKNGAKVLVIDANLTAGGQLFKQIHKFFGSSMHRAGVRGIDIGSEMLTDCIKNNVEIYLGSVAIAINRELVVSVERDLGNGKKNLELIQAERIVLASGGSENAVRFKGWTLPGVMGAGAIQTMINVNRVLPGRNVLMIGSSCR